MIAPVGEVRCEGLVVERGGRAVLHGIDLDVLPGQHVAVLGANGSGKSTLLLTIAGLLRPAGGRASAVGRKGIVLQRTSLDPLLTVEENAMLFARVHGVTTAEAQRRLSGLWDITGLADRRSERVGRLSGGLARRADLLRAYVTRPDVLLLDEPAAGLDEPSRRAILELVRTLASHGTMTVVWVTHDDAEARAADRVVVLDEGSIAADGSPLSLAADADLRRCTVQGRPPTILPSAEAAAVLSSSLREGLEVRVEPVSILEHVLSSSQERSA